MNYRHSYHAGNFADVFKHCILILLMQSLLQKDKEVTYLDTHAGIGKYDLTAEDAQKTKEYENGIRRLYKFCGDLELPPLINDYLRIVKEFNPGCSGINNFPRFYPGSPWIVRALLRKQDYMILVEKHPDEMLSLKKEFKRDKKVAVHYLDGFQGLKAFLPPKNGRGLTLIDPSYEDIAEFQKIVLSLEIVLDRFPIGIYAIWYPIKDLAAVKHFHQDLIKLNVKKILIAELSVGVDLGSENGLRSCGMVIINPPWKFEEKLKPVLEYLRKVLAIDVAGGFSKILHLPA